MKFLAVLAFLFALIIIVVILAFLTGAVYIVDETQQVVVTQFGKPVGKPITQAGLHFRKPLIQSLHIFDKRLLEWDGNPNQIPTKDKKYIWVDTTARWRIVDALKFLQSVNNENNAQARLDDIINSATRDSVTNQTLVDTVRNSNQILETTQEGEDVVASQEAIDKINIGRQKLEQIILDKAKQLAPQYGIAIVDVRIKRINYVENVRQKVYERMIAERKRAAEKYRSEGRGKRAEIEGQMEKELKLISSEAYKTAQTIKGKADAQVTTIYAEAYSQDPEFYSFLRTLETYEDTIEGDSTILLTTNSEYYKYLKDLNK